MEAEESVFWTNIYRTNRNVRMRDRRSVPYSQVVREFATMC